MNNILKILSVFVFCVILASCSKNSSPEVVPLRDYAEQYNADLDSIDVYIDTHYMTVDPTTFDVAFAKIPVGGTQMSIRLQTQYPIKDTTVAEDGINYKIYFIKFREGTNKRPTAVDSVHIAYRGIRLTDDQFDVAQTPVWFKLQEVITGWAHIIPNFHTGTYTPSTGPNPASFNNFGAGIMFLPSGLAYYGSSVGTIPTYAPIIFNFKLYELQYRDHDGDGILSKDERIYGPDPLTDWTRNPNLYDSDGDGFANMYDIDDDGDNFTTKSERKYISNGKTYYYPFNGALTDDPATIDVDETKGVPACGNTDYTSSNRIRKYLDPSCH